MVSFAGKLDWRGSSERDRGSVSRRASLAGGVFAWVESVLGWNWLLAIGLVDAFRHNPALTEHVGTLWVADPH
jgi:hypothetical protein